MRNCPLTRDAKPMQSVIGLVRDFRFCPVPEALEGLEVLRLVNVCEQLRTLPTAGGLGDQPAAFVSAADAVRMAKNAAEAELLSRSRNG